MHEFSTFFCHLLIRRISHPDPLAKLPLKIIDRNVPHFQKYKHSQFCKIIFSLFSTTCCHEIKWFLMYVSTIHILPLKLPKTISILQNVMQHTWLSRSLCSFWSGTEGRNPGQQALAPGWGKSGRVVNMSRVLLSRARALPVSELIPTNTKDSTRVSLLILSILASFPVLWQNILSKTREKELVFVSLSHRDGVHHGD